MQRERENAATEATVDLAKLPLADAIKTVLGNGERKLYVFSDPGCAYCRRLEAELAKLKDTTIYTFVVAFQGRQLPQTEQQILKQHAERYLPGAPFEIQVVDEIPLSPAGKRRVVVCDWKPGSATLHP